MEGVSVACGQITWGREVPQEQILSEIALAGYEGAPADGQAGSTGAETLAFFGRFGLRPAPGYLGVSFREAEERARALERAARSVAEWETTR